MEKLRVWPGHKDSIDFPGRAVVHFPAGEDGYFNVHVDSEGRLHVRAVGTYLADVHIVPHSGNTFIAKFDKTRRPKG